MHLIEVILPQPRRSGSPMDRQYYRELQTRIVDKFGGVTSRLSSSAKGLWTDNNGEVEQDNVIVFDVMVEEFDKAWWALFRSELESRFGQQEILIRKSQVEKI